MLHKDIEVLPFQNLMDGYCLVYKPLCFVPPFCLRFVNPDFLRAGHLYVLSIKPNLDFSFQ